jgi:hypothetical protein
MAAGASSGMRRAGVEQRSHLAERRPQVAVALAPDSGVARIRRVEAEDDAHRRRLAGAVGPDEARDAAVSTPNDKRSTASVRPYRFVRPCASIAVLMRTR